MNGDVAFNQLIIVGSNFLDQAAFVLRSHLPSHIVFLAKALIAVIVFRVIEGTLKRFGIHKAMTKNNRQERTGC